MTPSTEKLRVSLRALRTLGGSDFRDLVDWLQQSLYDQTLTNEQTLNPNLLLVGQGKSACMREIVQELTRD